MAFARLALAAGDVLELRPSHEPLLEGPRVRSLDAADRFSVAPATFDAVLSSHIIGYRPDFVAHLAEVRRVLRPSGRYFLLIPDKNYCFQHFMAPSTLAQLLDAHVAGRTLHTLRSQIAHAALGAHNNAARHWRGDHGRLEPSAAAIARAVAEHQKRGTAYDDVPAWCFEPDSFLRNMQLLRELGETDFSVVRLYPTLLDNNEFWAVLESPGGAK
jgi:SAM-dependent methyltransferase